MAKLSIKKLKAVAKIAATNDVRYYINGVHIEIEKDQIIYVATNGHRLIAHRCPQDSITKKFVGKTFILSSKSIAQLKPENGSDHLSVEDALEIKAINSKSITLQACAHDIQAITLGLIDGKFQDWKKAIPKAAAATQASDFGIDYKYCLEIQQAFKGLSGYRSVLVKSFWSDVGSLGVSAEGDPLTIGVIMPIRQKGLNARDHYAKNITGFGLGFEKQLPDEKANITTTKKAA